MAKKLANFSKGNKESNIYFRCVYYNPYRVHGEKETARKDFHQHVD